MYNRESILKTLNAENYYVDKHSLDLFLHDWKIDSIYEDESGLEFYDDLAIEKIKKGISLKAQSYTDEQIVIKLQKMSAKPQKDNTEAIQPILVRDFLPVESEPVNTEEQTEVANVSGKNFTLDVTSQTLQMLAEAVAKKISDDITNSDFATKLIEAGGYKRDNEIMAKQIAELLEHNQELSSRIEQLENYSARSFWNRIWNKK